MELNQHNNQPQLVKQIPVHEIEDGEIDNGQVIKLILLLSAILLTGIIVCLFT